MLVVARQKFDLMSALGGTAGQRLVKKVAKGDLLRVDRDVSDGAGLAYAVTVMRSRAEPEREAGGAERVGVTSGAWIEPAPVAPATTAAPSAPGGSAPAFSKA